MHRSGTSLVASWLEACGLSIHDGNVMGPNVGNIRGHFEDLDFVDLQAAAIKSQYPASDGWKMFGEASPLLTSTDLLLAQRILTNRNQKYKLWGWKDPRSIVFLEQWREIIPSLKTVLIWRPCFDVVYSLIQRAQRSQKKLLKISLGASVKLWKYYNRLACDYKEKYPEDTLLFSLEFILQHDKRVWSLLNERLHIGLDYSPLTSSYDRKILHRGLPPFLKPAASFSFRSRELEDRLRTLSDT